MCDKADAASQYDTGKLYLSECVHQFEGLKLLRQPVWETLCMFIISANNNIKRIQGIYRNLSNAYGEKVYWDKWEGYAFPAAQALARADEAGLRAAGLGYRAPYILNTAKTIAESGLPDLDGLGYEDALKYLTSLSGVGEKVADCILLFSTRHQNAFPIDVWMERALRQYYGMDGTRREMKKAAQAMFGGAAGIVQQYLYHGIRSGVTFPPDFKNTSWRRQAEKQN